MRVPGRLERRGEQPLEIWDGAHNLAGIGYLLAAPARRRFTIVASILADKDAEAMLAALTSALGDTLVATQLAEPARAAGRRSSPTPRRATSPSVEVRARPGRGARPARELAGPTAPFL